MRGKNGENNIKGLYKMINKNPINIIIKLVKGGTKKETMDDKQRTQLIVQGPRSNITKHNIIKHFGSSQNSQRRGAPLRPIVSEINSPA